MTPDFLGQPSRHLPVTVPGMHASGPKQVLELAFTSSAKKRTLRLGPEAFSCEGSASGKRTSCRSAGISSTLSSCRMDPSFRGGEWEQRYRVSVRSAAHFSLEPWPQQTLWPCPVCAVCRLKLASRTASSNQISHTVLFSAATHTFDYKSTYELLPVKYWQTPKYRESYVNVHP